MKKITKTGLALIFMILCMTITAFSITPVINVLSAEREKDGTVTVVVSPSEEYNIVELRFASGTRDKSYWDSATVIHDGVISGLKTGKYTVFAKSEAGNIGAYPLTVGEEAESEASSTAESESWEEKESTEWGGSWIKYSVEAGTVDPTEPEQQELTISKREVAKSEELPGAKLIIKDKSGKTVEEWTSGNKPHVIPMLKDGTYTLTEITAPQGYEVAETITFVIEKGTVIHGAEYDNHVIMYDSPSTPETPKKENKPVVTDTKGPGEPTTAAPTTVAPTEATEQEILPQTGGLDERMLSVLGIAAFLVLGGGLYLIGNKFSK